jgi:hypothetical protein
MPAPHPTGLQGGVLYACRRLLIQSLVCTYTVGLVLDIFATFVTKKKYSFQLTVMEISPTGLENDTMWRVTTLKG